MFLTDEGGRPQSSTEGKLIASASHAHPEEKSGRAFLPTQQKKKARFANMRLNVMGQQAYPRKCPTNV